MFSSSKIWLILCIFISLISLIESSGSYAPLCTNMLYDDNGLVDVDSMLYNCSGNIQGSLLPPSMFRYDGSAYAPTIVNVTIAINTLIKVDDVSTQVTLDLWFRQYWRDDRWNFPEEMWQSMNPAVHREGMEIAPYIRNSNQLNIWLPDTYIIEAVEADFVSELIHLFPNRTIFWSRHFLVTLTEPQMDLHDYPDDTQDFRITLQSFAYSTDYVLLSFINHHGIVFVPDSSGQPYASLNQLWNYDSSSQYTSNDGAYIFFNPLRHYSTVYLSMNFARQSFGIVFRLALPITIFLFIVGFSFWAEEDKRIDITVNMLLVISALYLVIGQVIPFVGYYTTLDLYITSAFMLLAATCGIHFIILQFRRKQDKYPLLELISFYIVYFFRILWLPSAILMFILFFNLTEVYIIVPFVLVTIGSIANGISHYHQYAKVYRNTMANLKKKHENSDFRVSTAEGLVIAAGGVELQDLSKDHLGKPGDRQTTRNVLNEYLNKIHEQHEDMAREKKEEEEEEEEELKRQARAMKGMSAASQLPPPQQQHQHQQQKFSSRISDLFNDSDDEND